MLIDGQIHQPHITATVTTDPFSISASIAGLITLADVVFCRIFKYVKGVKGAPKAISALSSEIGALYGILNSVLLIVCQLEGETFDSTIQTHHVQSCYQTLEKVKKVLDKHGTTSPQDHSVETIKRRLRWPFSMSEAEDLIAEVERHKATMGLALTVDGMSGLLQALSRQTVLHDGVTEIKRELQHSRAAETRIEISGKRKKILDSFGPIDPYKNHHTSLKLRHPGTGLWLTESDEFKHWLKTPNAKLWLYGIPGAGKTVLASSVIQQALRESGRDIATAFYYCDYKDPVTQDPINILGSLAKQIAKQDEQSFEKLQRFFQNHHPDEKPSNAYNPDDLRDLVIAMTSSFESAMVVVDALDECGQSTSHVTELLASLNMGREKSTIKTLFFSRNEQDIRDFLEDYTQVSIAARSSDLRLYVGAEIELRTRKKKLRIKDPSLKEHIMERLVDGADGMYVFIHLVSFRSLSVSSTANRPKISM